MIKLVIIEEFSLIRLGLRQLLKKDPSIQVIGESDKGSQTLQLIRTLNPNVVLLDVNLPDISGLEVTHRLIANNKSTKILMITANDSELFLERFLEAGALGCISKNSCPEELINAVNSVNKGKIFISSVIAHQLTLSKNQGKTEYLSYLTDREIEVVRMTIRGWPIKKIAEKLHISDETIHSYRSKIFQKLHVKNEVELLIKALQSNILNIEEIYLDYFR